MTDDTGWNDFGAYGGGANLGHPTPNIDKIAQEGAVYGPDVVRRAAPWPRLVHDGAHPNSLRASVVIAPGDENGLTKSTPTIAESSQ